jgi:hypothetical protein
MSVTERTSYDPVGFWARFKRASVTLGVPIALAAIIPIAAVIIAAIPKEAWMLLAVAVAVAVALADLRTIVRRRSDRKRKSNSHYKQVLGGFLQGSGEKTTVLEGLLILVVFFVGLPLMVAHEFWQRARRSSQAGSA